MKTLFSKLIMLTATLLYSYQAWAVDIEEVIYGRKDGMALTMGVVKPNGDSNGKGVILIQSGGFYSDWKNVPNLAKLSQPLNDHGYTTFIVVHGSVPKYCAVDALNDVRRAIRFIRHNAETYGVDPNKLGITGGSAGGQTALLLSTQPLNGNPEADDPVERESTAVQAVACFFPLTDFVLWDENHDDFQLSKKMNAGYTPYAVTRLNKDTNTYERVTDEAELKQVRYNLSPIYFVGANTPPTLIAHGSGDKAIDIDQSIRYIAKLKENGVKCMLINNEGAPHGNWPDMTMYYSKFADWYDIYLK